MNKSVKNRKLLSKNYKVSDLSPIIKKSQIAKAILKKKNKAERFKMVGK